MLHTHTKHGLRLPLLLHTSYIRLLFGPIMYRCLLRVLCPVSRSVATLDCVLLKDSSLVLAVVLGPEINFLACLWVVRRPHHIAICCLSIQHFIFFLIFCLEIPKASSGPANWSTVPSSVSSLAISFPCTLECVCGPRTDPQNASWTCYSVPYVTVVCCFGSLKGFQSHLTARTDTNVLLWSNVHTNFTCTGQDSIHLGLQNNSIFSYRDAEPSSQRLPIVSSPTSPPRPGPVCIPDEPLKYGRGPRSSGPLFSTQHSNPILGFKFQSWPHNIDLHMKYGN